MSAPAATTGAPQSKRRNRRRVHLRGPFWLLAILVVLTIIFVLLDKTSTAVAQDKVATKLTAEQPFTGRPAVTIKGFPFLTQALHGEYRHIVVSGPADPIQKLGAVALQADLYGVHVPASSVLSGVSSVPVDRLTVQMSVPVSRVAAALDVAGLTMRQSGANVIVSAPVPIPAIGTERVTATGRLTLTAKLLTTTISSVKVAGTPLPVALADQVEQALTLRLPVNALGVTAASIRVVGTSIVVNGTAQHVTLK